MRPVVRNETGPSNVTPSFIWMVRAPPSAFSPKAGLLLMTSIVRTAVIGVKSQLTVSPNASLMRVPF
jgi:hypothetical protein